MPKLDDSWFKNLLEACYDNPREVREAQRKHRRSQGLVFVTTESNMVKNKRGSSSRKTPDTSSGEESRRAKEKKRTTSSRSTRSGDRAGPSARSPPEDPAASAFDIRYAVTQAHAMYKGKDSRQAARALFLEGHPDVTLDKVVDVARELKLRASRQFLEYVGLVEEAGKIVLTHVTVVLLLQLICI